MELHGTADKVLKLQESDDEGSDKSENEKKSVTNNCAHSAISDLEVVFYFEIPLHLRLRDPAVCFNLFELKNVILKVIFEFQIH